MKLLLLRTDHGYKSLGNQDGGIGLIMYTFSSPPPSLNSMFAEPIRQELLHLSLGRVLCERMLGTRRF